MKSLGDMFDLKKKRKQCGSNANPPDSELQMTSQQKVELELSEYMSSSLSTLPGSADPLLWWKCTGESMFPTLSKLAKRYLSMNATSVASERLFSLSGHIVNKKRSSMKADTVNRMVFLACNLE